MEALGTPIFRRLIGVWIAVSISWALYWLAIGVQWRMDAHSLLSLISSLPMLSGVALLACAFLVSAFRR